MNSNRDLLKEAIADAKAVKETAIANAKAALEESFGPFLREKLAMKLSEMDEMDEVEKEVEEGYGEEMEESYEMDEAETNKMDETETNEMEEAKEEMDEELDLEALLRELDGMEEGEEGINEAEDLLNDPKGPTAHGNVAEEEEMGEEEEEINIEDMSADDLKDFIESVITDMIEAGELEAGEGAESEEDEEEGKEKMMGEVDLEELMAEVKKEKMKSKGREDLEEAKRKAAKAEMDKKKAEKELQEAYATLEEIQSSLQEVKLLNAKLLYTNKIFRAKNLTESQKVKVLESFDKATSVKEAKLVYETLNEGLKTKKPVNESMVRGLASKAVGSVETKKPIFEVDSQFARWQVLAGIKNND